MKEHLLAPNAAVVLVATILDGRSNSTSVLIGTFVAWHGVQLGQYLALQCLQSSQTAGNKLRHVLDYDLLAGWEPRGPC